MGEKATTPLSVPNRIDQAIDDKTPCRWLHSVIAFYRRPSELTFKGQSIKYSWSVIARRFQVTVFVAYMQGGHQWDIRGADLRTELRAILRNVGFSRLSEGNDTTTEG
jgi:hypothetical protein